MDEPDDIDAERAPELDVDGGDDGDDRKQLHRERAAWRWEEGNEFNAFYLRMLGRAMDSGEHRGAVRLRMWVRPSACR